MCGIAGQLSFNSPADRALVRKMTRSLSHRGPDDERFYFNRNIGLGHRRLSLIDLKSGTQPMQNEDGEIWLIYNSEIYNYIELRDELKSKGHIFRTESDTEVVVHLYEEMGETCVTKLEGMFASALWDERRKRLFLARDRFGIKPLSYFQDQHGLIFGSEIKALLNYQKIDKTLNFSAIDQYFSFLYILEPYSIFKNIRKLPPAHYLICENNQVTLKQYWDINFKTDGTFSERHYQDQLKAHVDETIRLTLRSDKPLGIFLSGGIDSTVLSGVAKKINNDIKTFSVMFEENLYSEEKYSRLAAKEFDTDHHELVVTQSDALKIIPKLAAFFEEPFGDSSSIPTYCLSQLARNHVTGILTGEGGDELFAGYPWHNNGTKEDDNFASLLNHPGRVIFNRIRRMALYSKDLKEKICTSSSVFFPNRLNDLNILERFLYLDLKTYLPSDMLVKIDRMSMMNSLEGRVPYLNHKYAEFAASIPSKLKLKTGIQKYIFKKTFQSLIPKEIANRRKMGFSIPLFIWLWRKGKFRKLIRDTLFDSKTKKRGFFNYAVIEKMFDEHDRMIQRRDQEIWSLFIFELWHRNFVDQA